MVLCIMRQVNMMSKELSQAEREAIDAALAFIALLSEPDFTFGEWRTPEGQFPQYIFSPEASRLIDALSKLIIVFDWPAWSEEANTLMEDPAALAKADLPTLRKLITTHLRAERFNEGHLAGQFENGHLLAALQRLKELKERS
jgi:hypothetical protein